jgi:hypothetical protein
MKGYKTMNENQKIYTVYTIDYKGDKTKKGATLQENKAKALVKAYESHDIKATYEIEDLYEEDAK